jgi:hypothetical protein
MREGTQIPLRPGNAKVSPLSNWPRYPGGAIAGAVIGVASVLAFFFGISLLRYVFLAALAVAVVLRVLRSSRSED